MKINPNTERNFEKVSLTIFNYLVDYVIIQKTFAFINYKCRSCLEMSCQKLVRPKSLNISNGKF